MAIAKHRDDYTLRELGLSLDTNTHGLLITLRDLVLERGRLLYALQGVMNHRHIQAYLPYAPNDPVMKAAAEAIQLSRKE